MSRTLYKTGAFERSGRSLFCAVYGSFLVETQDEKCVTDKTVTTNRTEVGIL